MSNLDAFKSSESKSFKRLNPHLFNPTDTLDVPYPHGGEDDEEHEHIAALNAKSPCRIYSVKDHPSSSSTSHFECVKHGRDCPQLTEVKPEKKKKRIRQSEKPILNRLESEWYEHIKHYGAYPQAVKLKIARSAFYKPDFFSFAIATAWEVKGLKGKNIDRGKLALKVAATAWPEIKFILVWKDEQGVWQEQVVLP